MNTSLGKTVKVIIYVTWPLLLLYFIIEAAVFPHFEMKPDRPGDILPESRIKEELIMIPGGEFLMGSDSDGDHNPAHRVQIDPFFMDKYEVTNAQYLKFCEATDRRLPDFWGKDEYRCGPRFPDHPVIGVSWSDAESYAAWAGKRLPTEAEWEYAARGGLEGMEHVNGNELAPSDGNYTKSEKGGTVPVGSYPANGYGLHDMQGNVVEWVHDYYDADYYSISPDSNPWGPESGRFRVIRGGGWHSGPSCNRVYFRNALPSNWVDFNVGFRCVKDVERPAYTTGNE